MSSKKGHKQQKHGRQGKGRSQRGEKSGETGLSGRPYSDGAGSSGSSSGRTSLASSSASVGSGTSGDGRVPLPTTRGGMDSSSHSEGEPRHRRPHGQKGGRSSQVWREKGPRDLGILSRSSPALATPAGAGQKSSSSTKPGQKAGKPRKQGKTRNTSKQVVAATILDLQKAQGEQDALKEIIRDQAAELAAAPAPPPAPPAPPRRGQSANPDEVVIDILDPEDVDDDGDDESDDDDDGVPKGPQSIAGATLIYAEHAMMNLQYKYHEDLGWSRVLLRLILATLITFVAVQTVSFLKHWDLFETVLAQYGPFVWALLLLTPAGPFWFIWPAVIFLLVLKDILDLRAGRGQTLGLPVQHRYTAVPGTLRRTGVAAAANQDLAEELALRHQDLRPHGVSQADLKYLNAILMDVEYQLRYLYIIPIFRVNLSISGEILSQILYGKNMVASTDVKTTAVRMETYGSSLQVINYNRYETFKGVHRVPDTIRVAYGAYRQYYEQRLVVPFPVHPLRP